LRGALLSAIESAAIRAPWPPDDRRLPMGERIGLQQRLVIMGYDVHDFQGRIDFNL
jgi:hypothetical protein